MAGPFPLSIHGIDVSHHQGEIDWGRVLGAGVRFAWLKASTGNGGQDRRYRVNLEDAVAAGIPCGAYHWLKVGKRNATDEARHFARVAFRGGDMPVGLALPEVLDVEEAPPSGMTRAQTLAYVLEAADALEDLSGRRCVIYTGADYCRRYLPAGGNFGDRPVWVAQYNRPSGNYPADTTGPRVVNSWVEDWAVWQYSSRGAVDGIKGRVDLNVIRPGGRVAWLRPAVNTPAAPLTAPPKVIDHASTLIESVRDAVASLWGGR